MPRSVRPDLAAVLVAPVLLGLWSARAPAQVSPEPSPVTACEAPLPGVETRCGAVRADAGYAVQTILTRPAGVRNRLPAILFVQWLSCDPVTVTPSGGDGWAEMLRTLVQRSGVVLARTEKPGLGGSGGPACTELGYDEELAAHASALRALARSDWVHPDSIVIFGASMGGTMAPLLGRIHPVSGIIVWGTTGLTWAEHMLALDRRVLALRGVPPAQRKAQLDEQLRFHAQYLGEQRQPRAIVAATPALGAAWRRMLGTDTAFTSQYGRPVRFHHEAQRADWIAAWGDVADAATPVLIAYGEHDWIMGEAEHLAIKQLLDAIRPGCAASRRIAGASHGFEQVERPVLGGASGPFAREAADAVLQWLTDHRRTMHTARGCGRRS